VKSQSQRTRRSLRLFLLEGGVSLLSCLQNLVAQHPGSTTAASANGLALPGDIGGMGIC